MSDVEERNPLEGLETVISLVEVVRSQQKIMGYERTNLLLNGQYTCGATESYINAFDKLEAITDEILRNISVYCDSQVERLEQAVEEYKDVRLQAMANCSREDCPDRETARRELGWNGENPPSIQ